MMRYDDSLGHYLSEVEARLEAVERANERKRGSSAQEVSLPPITIAPGAAEQGLRD